MAEKRGYEIKMKKIKIKIPKENKPSIMKETPEERKERLRYSSAMISKVVPNKKKNTRAKQRNLDTKELKSYLESNDEN